MYSVILWDKSLRKFHIAKKGLGEEHARNYAAKINSDKVPFVCPDEEADAELNRRIRRGYFNYFHKK